MQEIEIANERLIYNHRHYKPDSDNGPKLIMHSHGEYELIFFEKGDAVILIEDNKYALKENDLVFIRPLKYHFVELKEGSEYKRFNIAFNNSFIGEEILSNVPADMEIINCPQGSLIAENFRKLHRYACSFDNGDLELLIKSLLTEVFLNMRFFNKDIFSIPYETSQILSNAIEYVNDNLGTVKSLKEICDKLFITESYLFKLFKKELKISPKKYVNLKRLYKAQAMLKSGVRPKDVFYACGFETYTAFYKQYKQTFGHVPSEEKQN